MECKEKSKVCFVCFQTQNTVFDTSHGFLFRQVSLAAYRKQMQVPPKKEIGLAH
jgi:hypothetical protein